MRLILYSFTMVLIIVSGVTADEPYTQLEDSGRPSKFSLTYELPHPFAGDFPPTFTLPYTSTVSMSVLDTLGNEVCVFETRTLSPGCYVPDWWVFLRDKSIKNGLYYIELRAVAEVAGYENVYFARQPHYYL